MLSNQIRLFPTNITYSCRDVVFYLNASVYFKQVGLAGSADDPFPGADIVILYIFRQFEGVFDDLVEELLFIKIVLKTGVMKTGCGFNTFLAPC